MTLYEEGIAAAPGNHKLWLFAAQAHTARAAGRGAAAEAAAAATAAPLYERALALDAAQGFGATQPSSFRAYGNALLQLGPSRAAEATAAFHKALELLGGDPASEYALVRALKVSLRCARD